MGLNISLEVHVPPDVPEGVLLRLGKHVCAGAGGNPEGMTVDEALEWAFGDPGAIGALASLGVTWDSIRNGNITIDSKD